QSLVVRAVMESGDAIVIPVYTRDPNNPLKLRVLEGDYIDHSKNGDLVNNTYAVLGVVFNSKHERIGYYIHKTHPGESSGHYTDSSFLSIDLCAHVYERTRPGQVRGVPRGVAAMTRIRSLDDYQDARLEAAKAAACLVGAVVDVEGVAIGEERQPDILPDRLEPGMFPRLGNGEDIRF